MIEVAKIEAGQTVLISAAAGGVGIFAVQIAKLAGARVIGIASGDGITLARELGADEVVDRHSESVLKLGQTVDVVLDPIGGETQDQYYEVLKKGGYLVSVSTTPSAEKAASYGVRSARVSNETVGARLEQLSGLVGEGKVRVVTDRRYSFKETSTALAHSASGRARGKILIEIA